MTCGDCLYSNREITIESKLKDTVYCGVQDTRVCITAPQCWVVKVIHTMRDEIKRLRIERGMFYRGYGSYAAKHYQRLAREEVAAKNQGDEP